MTPRSSSKVLAAGDPPPFTLHNLAGSSPFLLIGDHAGNTIGTPLKYLGLNGEERTRHIAWDIGIAGLGRALSARLDAAFIAQTYSRLVIDCNRDPASVEAIPGTSDGTHIPGNVDLDQADRAERVAAIHEPYHAAIATALDGRIAAGRRTIFIALHSFTPVFGGVERPWHVGVLHDAGDTRFALAVLAALQSDSDLVVGDNEPYRMDATDHCVPRHCYPRRLPYLELEVRQDLIAEPEQQVRWAERLAHILHRADAAHTDLCS
jgi:predicted N-formylglutamate amidohydrolase